MGFYTNNNTDLEEVCCVWDTIHDILAATGKNQSVHAAVLYFRKAFDRVPHSLLIE